MQQAQPMTQPGQSVNAGGNQPQMYGQMYMGGSGPAQGCGGCMPQQNQQHQQQQQQSQQLPQQQQGPGGFAPQMMMAGCR